MNEIDILVIGKKLDLNMQGVEVDFASGYEEAKQIIRSKFYDVIITSFELPDNVGPEITKIYPHYRCIIYVENEEQQEKVKSYRNGFGAVVLDPSLINQFIYKIVSSHPKKEHDTLMALMNIQASIEELNCSQNFIKNNFNSIHGKLKKLEESQKNLEENFVKFEDKREIAEQFFLDTVLQIRGKNVERDGETT